MAGPLRGVRVLDLTHVLNGPFCTMLLSHMGAEVIKVEFGAGDRYRRAWMPADSKRDGYGFVAVNSNKKGITLDLKTEEGKGLLRRLVSHADVLAENFATGVMDSLQLGYEALKAENSRLIYACARAYGDSGPYAHVRGNAATNEAISGWTSAAKEAGGHTLSGDMGIGDEAAGVSLALGICAALYERERSGHGQKIEVSMQEALLGFMIPTLHGHFEGTKVGVELKECTDGHYTFFVNGITDKQMLALAGALGRPDLAEDARFATAGGRAKHQGELELILSEFVRRRTREDLWRVLSAAGISSAPVNSVGEAIEDKHLRARGAFVEIDHPVNGRVRVPGPWIRFSKTPCEVSRPSPMLGQHNREVYGDLLGLDEEQLKKLASQGVFRGAAFHLDGQSGHGGRSF